MVHVIWVCKLCCVVFLGCFCGEGSCGICGCVFRHEQCGFGFCGQYGFTHSVLCVLCGLPVMVYV